MPDPRGRMAAGNTQLCNCLEERLGSVSSGSFPASFLNTSPDMLIVANYFLPDPPPRRPNSQVCGDRDPAHGVHRFVFAPRRIQPIDGHSSGLNPIQCNLWAFSQSTELLPLHQLPVTSAGTHWGLSGLVLAHPMCGATIEPTCAQEYPDASLIAHSGFILVNESR